MSCGSTIDGPALLASCVVSEQVSAGWIIKLVSEESLRRQCCPSTVNMDETNMPREALSVLLGLVDSEPRRRPPKKKTVRAAM